MVSVGDTVISLTRWSQVSCGSRGNAREPNVNTDELHTGRAKDSSEGIAAQCADGWESAAKRVLQPVALVLVLVLECWA